MSCIEYYLRKAAITDLIESSDPMNLPEKIRRLYQGSEIRSKK